MRLLLVLGLLTAFGRLYGQDPFLFCQPSLQFSDTRSGLPADTVHALLLDRQGTLWAGTLDGPARYAGGAWEPLRLPADSRSNYIRALLQDRAGAIWFGTQDGGLWRLKDGAWSHCEGGRELPSNRINCLLETTGSDGGAVLWVGTGAGIACLEQGRWRAIGRAQGLAGENIWKLRETRDADGRPRLWAASQDGLFTGRDGLWRRLGPVDGFRGASVNDLLETRGQDGRSLLWASCWGLGIACWDGERWTHFEGPGDFPSRFPTCLASSEGPDGAPVVWAGTFDNYLASFAGGRWQALARAEGNPVTGIYALLAVPRSKPTLLLGTRGSGVAFLDLGGWRTLDARLGLPGNEVNAFAQTDDAFWIGTSKGLARWDARGRAVGEQVGDGVFPYINRLHVTRAGAGRETLWAATLQGLFRRAGGRWQPVRDLPVLQGAIHSFLDTVSTAGVASLWVGTDRGLACLEQGRWRTCLPEPGQPGCFVASLAASSGAGGAPVIWAGTRGRGVGCLRDGAWSWLGADAGLPNPSVYGLVATRGRDGRSWLWAGMPGGGLGRLQADRPESRWEIFNSRNTPGFRTDSLSGLLLDGRGRLYAPTTKGVLRITLDEAGGAPAPAQVENFTTEDGLPSNTIASNFTFLDRGGRVWLGTPKGAAVLDPALETGLPAPPAPQLRRVLADNREAGLDRDLVFGHRARRLVFEFLLPSFHRQDDTRFRTRIVGLEKEPTPWQAEPRRELTGLPAGRYQLEVWARDYAGRVTPALTVAIRILPPPWRSPWAYLAYVLALAAAAAAVLRWRTRILRRQNLDLQEQVRRRTEVILRQSQDLARSNAELSELNVAKETLIGELQGALAEVTTLQGFIPICSYCKKIRNDEGSWDQLEHYISAHSGASFSHGVCPDCGDKVRAEFRGTR